MQKELIALIVFVGICFAVAAFGAAYTQTSVKTWYPDLVKPAGNPPSWVFGPVWSTLYLMMAIAGWLVWRERLHEDVWLALGVFAGQLILNGLWSYIFFGLRRPGAALIEIVVLLLAIAATAVKFS